MKKTIRMIISILVIVSLVGCGTESTNTLEETTTADLSSKDSANSDYTYPIVDTNQGLTYNNSEIIEPPEEGEAFYGQDAQYTGNVPSYTDNGDGTVTDNVTGLMWAQELSQASMTWEEAIEYCENLELGGYDDWRLPTIKELWSIRDFSAGWPWVDTDYFYLVGDGSQGAQQHSWSSNAYLVDTEEAADTVAFAVNDWTGHIKSFTGARFVRAVRGDTYGINDFVDNGDGTITDKATGLMWAQVDSGEGMNWEDALAYAENSTYAGYDDWRLPNVKELQSIVDYSGVFPAIDPIFNITMITNEAGNSDYPYFWTSTTNPYIDPNDGEANGYCYAWYVAFGYAVDRDGNDSHGAGAVRFDTKVEGGPDGIDGERYYNYVRLVRGGNVTETPEGDPTTVDPDRVVAFEDGETGIPENGKSAPGNGPGAPAQEGEGGPESGQTVPAEEQGLPAQEGANELENDTSVPASRPAEPGQEDTVGPENGTGAPANGPGVPPMQEGAGGPGNGQVAPKDRVGGQPMIDTAMVAEKLGVTEEALIEALGTPNQGQPDFAAAAETLGVTEEALLDAMGIAKEE